MDWYILQFVAQGRLSVNCKLRKKEPNTFIMTLLDHLQLVLWLEDSCPADFAHSATVRFHVSLHFFSWGTWFFSTLVDPSCQGSIDRDLIIIISHWGSHLTRSHKDFMLLCSHECNGCLALSIYRPSHMVIFIPESHAICLQMKGIGTKHSIDIWQKLWHFVAWLNFFA